MIYRVHVILRIKSYIFFDKIFVIKQSLSKESIEISMSDSLEYCLSTFQLWFFRIFNVSQHIIGYVDISLWVEYLILKLVNWVSLKQGVDDHVIYRFADSVSVALLEEFVPRHKYLFNVLINLWVIAQSVVEDEGPLNQSIMLKTDWLET